MSVDIGLCAQLACILEVTARKPGNVHRFADLPKLHYLDLLASAAAIGPIFARASGQPVGAIVLDAIQATRRVTSTNTNLGTVLLFAPLAAVDPAYDLASGVRKVLANLTQVDAEQVYAAIRLAQAGGLGRVEHADISQVPTLTLREAMALAADRDWIAREYVTDFALVFEGAERFHDRSLPLESGIVDLYLHMLAAHPDSLIARKRGLAVAQELQELARQNDRLAMEAWFAVDPAGRNPGTTADLVAVCLFVALRTGIIPLPLDCFESTGAP